MNYYYVYLTTNLINGKNYVGKHFGKLNDLYKGSGVLINKAFDKYDKDNFSKEILAVCNSNKEVCILEKIYIDLYRSIGKAEYNIADGGEGGNLGEEWYKRVWNSCHTEEYSEKLSKSLKESEKFQSVIHSKEFHDKVRQSKLKNPYHHSEEIRQKISEKNKGKKRSKEFSRKISKINSHRIYSEETKRKISESQKKRLANKVYTEEELLRRKQAGLKIVEKLKDLRASNEYRQKLSNSIKNSEKHKQAMSSEITRKKISESAKNSEKKKKSMNSESYKEKIRIANTGRHKYNNGIIEVSAFECPEGFTKGSLTKSKGNKGMHWYNNGKIQICCYAQDCPTGFVKGLLKTHASTLGTKWYNNGVIEVMRKECPEGFVLGKLKDSHVKNKKWFNDGTKNIRAFECPEGFVPGMIKK